MYFFPIQNQIYKLSTHYTYIMYKFKSNPQYNFAPPHTNSLFLYAGIIGFSDYVVHIYIYIVLKCPYVCMGVVENYSLINIYDSFICFNRNRYFLLIFYEIY